MTADTAEHGGWDPFRWPRTSLIVFAVAFGIVLMCLLAASRRNPDYLADYRLNSNPDAVHYVLLGDNIWSGHGYSRQEGSPYHPDMLRTPAYPLLAGGV